MKLSPISLNFNYQTKTQKFSKNQASFSQLTCDTVSFKANLEESKRQEAEQALNTFKSLQKAREKTEIEDLSEIKPNENEMSKDEITRIINMIGAYKDLSKELLDSCSSRALCFADDREICFGIATKQPDAAQEFLCKPGFYAQNGRRYRPLYFTTTIQETKNLLDASRGKTYWLQMSSLNFTNKSCTKQDYLDFINLTEKDHELTFIIHRPISQSEEADGEAKKVIHVLDIDELLDVLDRFKNPGYRISLLLERAQCLGGYLKEQYEQGTLANDDKSGKILNLVLDSMNTKDIPDAAKAKLSEEYIEIIHNKDENFMKNLLAAKAKRGEITEDEAQNLIEYFTSHESSEKISGQIEKESRERRQKIEEKYGRI